MKNIDSAFKVIFNTKEFTDINILYFTEDHLQRLEKQNISASYDLMIKNTETLFFDLWTWQKKIEKSIKLKREFTNQVQNISDDLKESIRKLEGLIRSQFSKNSELYFSIFPDGLSEYCRLNRSNIETLMCRVLIFLKENEEIVTPFIKKEISELYSNYKMMREQQLSEFKKHENITKEKKLIRLKLSHQLQKNLYALAIEYLGDPDKASLYFNQRILNSKEQIFVADNKWKRKVKEVK